MVRNFFDAYLTAKEWLVINEHERETYFNNLPYTSPPCITYEEFTSSSTTTHDERMAMIADEMKKFDDDRRHMKDTSKFVILSCEKWLEEVDPRYRHFFVIAFMEVKDRKLEEVGKIVRHDPSWVGKKITSECKKIKLIQEAGTG